MAVELCAPAYWRGQQHSHHFFEQLYILTGEAEVRAANFSKKFIAGQAALISPNTDHQVINFNSEPLGLIYIGFSLNTNQIKKDLPEILMPTISKEDRAETCTRQKRTIEKYKKGFPPLSDLLEAVAGSLKTLEKFSPAISDFCINGIVDEACRYISSHTDRNLSAKRLAGKLYVSPKYLGEIFKRETDMTPKQYHNAIRMKNAWELLMQKKMNIDQVSQNLGFSSPEYFSRQFKNKFGIAPRNVKKYNESID